MARFEDHLAAQQRANTDEKSGISRRGFLIGSVAGSAMLAFGVSGASLAAATSNKASASETLSDGAFEPTMWYAIGTDGTITIHITKAEMGQHVATSLARLVIEELEADLASVEIVYVDSDPKWGYMITGGSWSVNHSYQPLSQAGAAGRIALIEAGARQMGVSVESCKARQGRVISGEQSLGYGEIVAAGLERSFTEDELAAIELKPASERRVLGTKGNALDVPPKTNGQAVYGIDYTLPAEVEARVGKTLHARPVLPPSRFGCKVTAVDDSEASKVIGYRQTIELKDPSGMCQGWLAVIADNFSAAMRATDLLKVEWSKGDSYHIDEAAIQAEGQRLVSTPSRDNGSLMVDQGDPSALIEGAATTVESTFTTSSVLHFTLEPANALAYEEEGQWHVHCGNQQQSLLIPLVAKALEVEDGKITHHQLYLGGGFGRRLHGDYAVPAALAAKALGRPVKMIFTRPDDSRFDCVRSPSVQRVRSGLDADGRVVASEHAAAAGWPTAALMPSFLAEAVEGGGKLDSFSISGADHWYNVGTQRVWAQQNKTAHEAFVPGYLRSVAPGWTLWAVEQHIDELALAAKQDPAEFRLSLLDAEGRNAGKSPVSTGGAERLRTVLKRVMEKSGWSERDSLPEDTGMGVALSFGQERSMPTWVACVARVKVDRATGEVKIEKLTSVVDAGTLAHPDGAMAQLEGSLLWGVSMALHEGTEYRDGGPVAQNLGAYQPLRMHQVPKMDLEFIDSTEMPVGLGEPGTTVVAPALANAIQHAVGVRLRDLPMRPAKLKAALTEI
ncbi:xanthine dehydrogenase family protein molybdopterin-binding subunit [Cobetia crustatorum]|uniref:xanthine dehydrogenase family protein molybdopterin-binding subunit n=1 Tax=Cobetia crustatorum TaxID=553385 RepID=UPI00046ADDE7|nr:molybdopterin cofactor-binding domain-containing protein [Cobetia crustatorum]